MSYMENVPVFGESFSKYAPLFVCLVCFIAFFDIIPRVASICNIKSTFLIQKDEGREIVAQGADLLRHGLNITNFPLHFPSFLKLAFAWNRKEIQIPKVYCFPKKILDQWLKKYWIFSILSSFTVIKGTFIVLSGARASSQGCGGRCGARIDAIFRKIFWCRSTRR